MRSPLPGVESSDGVDVARDKKAMSRRDMGIATAAVILAGVGFAVVQDLTGADTGTAVLAGVRVVLVTALGLTVNQVAARRRARRRALAAR